MTRSIYIEILNFRSILDMKFTLDSVGLNIIKADNGFGKSTIFEALYWVIFGKSLKKTKTIEPWQQIRPKNYEGTMVKWVFKKNGIIYTIYRCKNYKGKIEGYKGANRLIILKDGKIPKELRDKGDFQKYLLNILNTSDKLFRNTILFGQKVKRIIEETGPDKKQIFEEAFESLFLNRAREIAQNKLDKVEEDIKSVDSELITIDSSIEYQKEIKKLAKNFSKDKKQRLRELNEEFLSAQGTMREIMKDHNPTILPLERRYKFKLSNLKDEINLIKRSENKANQFQLQIDTAETEYSDREDDIKALKNKLTSYREAKCPECGGKLKNSKAKIKNTKKSIRMLRLSLKKVDNEIKRLKREISEEERYQNSKKSVNEEYDRINLLLEKLAPKIEAYRIAIKLKKAQETILTTIEGKITAEKQKKPEFDLKSIKQKLLGLKDRKLKLGETKALHETKAKDLKWTISGPLSNKGIKAYIFESMLEQVNERLEFYSQFTGLGIVFSIDLESARKDFYTSVNIGGINCNTEDLSGGQNQLVNVSLLFAIHDIVDSDEAKAFNILLLDEVFESLDKKNIELVIELLKAKAENKSLFLITHHEELQVSNSKLINLQYNNRITTLV